MCGIVGYIGNKTAAEVLVNGLARLEYRGYDSAGIALKNGSGIQVAKRAGRLENLARALEEHPLSGEIGIAHTRWATHGGPTDANAHPHLDCAGEISVVHNGIIENYQALRARLQAEGHVFRSETDSEVLAHLIEAAYQERRDPEWAVREALSAVRGSYAVVVLFARHPDALFAARKDSPLLIGLGRDEAFVASDVPAIIRHTRDIIALDDGEVARIERSGARVIDGGGSPVRKVSLRVDWDPQEAEKGGYAHFMLKEIHEQPQAVRNALRGRIEAGLPELSSLGWPAERIARYRRVHLVACGTAYHAGLVGKRLIEDATDLFVTAEVASEFRYANVRLDEASLVVVISQSGETADTLAALREARSRGADVLAITNVVGSSVAREADYVLYTQAGPEIAVASTKAYLTQLVCLSLIAAHMGAVRGSLTAEEIRARVEALLALPDQVGRTLEAMEPRVQLLAPRWREVRDVFFIGRGLDYAVAMEGQLKLKEISYIHAEALAAGELKHGTLALIEEGMPVIALATQPHLFEKTVSNLKEVAARGGRIIAIAPEGAAEDPALLDAVDTVWPLPVTRPELAPVLAVLPLQLLAYYVAAERGCDVDKPRNLAKSVTVE